MMLVLLVSNAGADVVKGTFRVVVDGTSSHHPSTTTATTASGPVYVRDSGLIVEGRKQMRIEVVHCAGTPSSMLRDDDHDDGEGDNATTACTKMEEGIGTLTLRTFTIGR